MHRMESQNIDSKFRLVLIAAERAERLLKGARPKMEFKSIKLARGALEEGLEGLVEWDYGPAPQREIDESQEGSLEEGEAPATE